MTNSLKHFITWLADFEKKNHILFSVQESLIKREKKVVRSVFQVYQDNRNLIIESELHRGEGTSVVISTMSGDTRAL